MKKVKYIDYNILLACLPKRPKTTTTQQFPLIEKRDISGEFYMELSGGAAPVFSGMRA